MSIHALIVEDDPLTAKLIQKILINIGQSLSHPIQCTCVTNTEDAEQLLMTRVALTFQMVILDNQFPEHSGGPVEKDQGLRVLREYRASPFWNRSIFFISSSSDDPKKFENEGFDEIVPKPLNQQKLSPLLQRAFDTRRLSS